MTRKFIQFEVTPEMHQSIRSTCAEMCISISQFMREATGVYLNLDRCPENPIKYERTVQVVATEDILKDMACIISGDKLRVLKTSDDITIVGLGVICPYDVKKGESLTVEILT